MREGWQLAACEGLVVRNRATHFRCPRRCADLAGASDLARDLVGVSGQGLFFLVFNSYRLEILGFEDLPAIETLKVVDAVPARDHLRALVVTGGLHKRDRDTTYFNDSERLVKGVTLFLSSNRG